MHPETDIAGVFARRADPSVALTASTSSRLSLTASERVLEEKAIYADAERESDWHRRRGHIVVKPLGADMEGCQFAPVWLPASSSRVKFFNE